MGAGRPGRVQSIFVGKTDNGQTRWAQPHQAPGVQQRLAVPADQGHRQPAPFFFFLLNQEINAQGHVLGRQPQGTASHGRSGIQDALGRNPGQGPGLSTKMPQGEKQGPGINDESRDGLVCGQLLDLCAFPGQTAQLVGMSATGLHSPPHVITIKNHKISSMYLAVSQNRQHNHTHQ